jgi:hypothetical protein
MTHPYLATRKSFTRTTLSITIASLLSFAVHALETIETAEKIEKVQVVGSHIKVGQVAEALAVSVLDAELIRT